MWHRQAKIKTNFILTNNLTMYKGTIVDITHGKDTKYAIWDAYGVFDVPTDKENCLEILNFYDPRKRD